MKTLTNNVLEEGNINILKYIGSYNLIIVVSDQFSRTETL